MALEIARERGRAPPRSRLSHRGVSVGEVGPGRWRSGTMSMARTAVEVDGLSAHGTREALDRDLARQNLLIRHGYLVLRYTRTHLRRPAKVAAEIIEVCQ